MDIKPPNTQIPIIVPVAYQRAVRALQSATLHTLPVSPDDIVDCVEIQTGKPSPANTNIIRYKLSDNPHITDKGTFYRYMDMIFAIILYRLHHTFLPMSPKAINLF